MPRRPPAGIRARLRLAIGPGLVLVAGVLGGCADLLRPEMPAVDPAAFAVPSPCRADMRVENNVLACGRRLMTVARDFGQAAHRRLATVLEEDLAPPGKIARAREVRRMIGKHCLEATPEMMALYDGGARERAVEEGVAPLSRCLLYAGKVMAHFGAADQAEALDRAVQRLTYAVHADDPFFGPPPGYDLGPVAPEARCGPIDPDRRHA